MANDFLKIFSDGWERFKSAVPSYKLARMWKLGKGWVFNIFDILFGLDIGPPGNLPDFCYD